MRRFFAFIAIVMGLGFVPGKIDLVYAQGDANPCPWIDTPGCTFGLPTDQYNQLFADMQVHPAPDVSQISVDKKEVESYTFYRILPDTNISDAPNGNVIGKVTDGFNFVSVYKVQDGFAMMRNKTWLRQTSLKRTFSSPFAGILFNK